MTPEQEKRFDLHISKIGETYKIFNSPQINQAFADFEASTHVALTPDTNQTEK